MSRCLRICVHLLIYSLHRLCPNFHNFSAAQFKMLAWAIKREYLRSPSYTFNIISIIQGKFIFSFENSRNLFRTFTYLTSINPLVSFSIFFSLNRGWFWLKVLQFFFRRNTCLLIISQSKNLEGFFLKKGCPKNNPSKFLPLSFEMLKRT